METPAQPQEGRRVTTACGGFVTLEPGTPRAVYRGRWIFFCLPACEQDFAKEPVNSCLVWQIATQSTDKE